MLINCQLLAGEKLEHIQEAHLGLEGSIIKFFGDGFVSGAEDLKDLLAMPGLVNAHTHLGDSFAKDACIGLSVQQAVGIDGMKWKLYEKADKKEEKKDEKKVEPAAKPAEPAKTMKKKKGVEGC